MSNENSDALREVKRNYYRDWRAKNPDKVRAAQERYWRRKLEEQKRAEPGIPKDAEIR